jgi:hypothetical protein
VFFLSIGNGINQWCGREHELKNTEVKSGAPEGIYSCSILLTAPESHLQSRCFVQIVSMVRVIQLCVLLFFFKPTSTKGTITAHLNSLNI